MIQIETDEQYIESLRVQVEQAKNDITYSEEGLTEEVVEKQADINKIREKYDIIDDEEVLYIDKDFRRFVQ